MSDDIQKGAQDALALSTILSFLLTGAMALAIFYQLGFFAVLGTDLFGSVALIDHLNSTIAIMPKSLVISTIGFLVGIGMSQQQSEYEQQGNTSGRMKARFFSTILWLSVMILLLMSLNWPAFYSALFAIAWLWFGSLEFARQVPSLMTNFKTFKLIHWAPAFLALAFNQGADGAERALSDPPKEWELCWASEKCEQVAMIRLYSSSAIYLLNGRPNFVAIDKLYSISAPPISKEPSAPLLDLVKRFRSSS